MKHPDRGRGRGRGGGGEGAVGYMKHEVTGKGARLKVCPGLTDAEKETVKAIASGKKQTAIASEMGISSRAVEDRLKRAGSRCGLRGAGIAVLTQFALLTGLADFEERALAAAARMGYCGDRLRPGLQTRLHD